MLGYFGKHDMTVQTWKQLWHHTGDLGYLDEDGFLYLVGRKKDLIIRGGNNIYPTDVEAVILEHPDVQEAAVIGVPHPVLGEDVAAFVVIRPDRNLDVDALLGFCAERLADYKRPRQVHLVDGLPRNATGKVMKHLLEVPAG
jgi:acyl-CoA synthetase (AMP-forming)/AMP-acid ligase II